MNKKIAIVGSGPAALMAAEVLSLKKVKVCIFEKRKSIGRKLLVAGSSGLNITNDLDHNDFISHYTGPRQHWDKILRSYSPKNWIEWIENLGVSTFLGTSGRYFIEDKKAARFLKLWQEKLEGQGVEFHFEKEWDALEVFDDGLKVFDQKFDAVILALGGGSWEPKENPLRWTAAIKKLNLEFKEFKSSNVGFKVAWPSAFLKEAEGQPIKNMILHSPRGSKKGEIMITSYGIEGTPVYFMGTTGPVKIDLKPDMTLEAVIKKMEMTRENLSPIRRAQKLLNLTPGAQALIFHMTPKDELKKLTIETLAQKIKAFPIKLLEPQPLAEAISSSGGLSWSELDTGLGVKKIPRLFCAGEMIDWDVPTGGFLIQGCVSQGKWAAESAYDRFCK